MHRRDERELIEDLVAADVAGMQNQVDARQGRVDVGPEQAVRVGDETDQNRLIPSRARRIPTA